MIAAVVAWRFFSPTAQNPPLAAKTNAALSSDVLPVLKPRTAPQTVNKASHEKGVAKVPKKEISAEQAGMDCESALSHKDSLRRLVAFDKLVSRALNDPDALRAILKTMLLQAKSGKKHPEETARFWKLVAQKDPLTAIALLQENASAEGIDYSMTVRRVVEEWASKDPREAIKWLESNKQLSDSQFEKSVMSLISGMARRDVNAATQYATSIYDPQDKNFAAVAKELARKAASQGDGALDKWFNALPHDGYKSSAFSSVGEALKETVSAEDYWAWLMNHAESPYRDDGLFDDAIWALAKNDPQLAMEAAMRLPPSPTNGSSTGIGPATRGWLGADPQSLQAFVNQLPNDRIRESILAHVRRYVRDPKRPQDQRNQINTLFSAMISPSPAP